MHKIVTLMLVLMLGGAPFAQAASMADCGMAKHNFSAQPQLMRKPGSCCEPCSLKADNTLFDKVADFSKISVSPEGVVSQTMIKGVVHPDPDWMLFFQKSPPKPNHLFSLYSVYRI